MDRRHEVLAALKTARGSAVSGETLASALGVTRAAVAKHVGALRDLGYAIEAAAGEGYRLAGVPDAPIPEEVSSLVTTPLWVRFEGGGATASTNDDAKSLARAGAPEGTVVLASEQTLGRGRLGRGWSSPPGGAYVSVVLRPPLAIAAVPPLALVVALGTALGLETLGAHASLKWPNDVLMESGKLAGVLLEMSAESDRVDWVVAGIGINVTRSRPLVHASAAYLTDVAAEATPAAAAAAVLDGVAGAYEQFTGGGFATLRSEYLARHTLGGREVTVRDAEGGLLAAGRVSDVDEWGRLVIETAEGPAALAAGEVTLA